MDQVLERPLAAHADPATLIPPAERPRQQRAADGATGDDNPWMSAVWLDTWWEVYGAQRRPRMLSLPDDEQAQWPMYEERDRHLRSLGLLGYSYCRHSLPQPESIPALAAQLAAQRDWDTLHFTGLPLDQARRWCDSLRAARLSASVLPAHQQRYLPLDRPWVEIEAEMRPSLLSNVHRRERMLEKLSPLQMRVQTDSGGLGPIFEECVALEASGWKGAQKTALAFLPEAQRFYRNLAFRAAAVDALHWALLYSGDTLIAFSFCLRRHRVLGGVKIAYHHDWRRYAPGLVLTYRLLQLLHREGMAELDFAGGDDAYKAEWTPHARALGDLRAFNRTLRGRTATIVARTRAQLFARLHPQPA